MGKINRGPFWKKALSYIYEFPIEQRSSPFNSELTVYLHRGRYQLCTANAIYSFDDLYTNFSKAFEKINIQEQKVENVLLLGLGLGSIPLLLEHTFERKYHYTAVEIDEEIIYLANKYVLKYLDAPIDCICTDANNFLLVDHQKYDLICMDVFEDDVIPAPFMESSFLELIQQRLSPNGIFLFNHLSLTSKDKKLATTYFEEVFQAFFPEASYIDVRSNYVLLNDQKFLSAS